MESTLSSPGTRSTTLTGQLRAALRKAPASVAIVTSGRGEQALGVTATAVTSVSLAPPAMLACVNKALRLNAAIRAHGRFRITYLRHEQVAIAQAFGGSLDRRARFQIGHWDLDDDYGAVLPVALASIACRLDKATDWGTHSIFIGHVEAVHAGAGAPLLYCNGEYASVRSND